MEKTEYPQKHRRGSSPRQEQHQAMGDLVRGVSPTEDGSHDLFESLPDSKKRTDNVKEFTDQAFNVSKRQPDDERRWQDDGGEAG